jgi:hypothetical protein
MQDISGPIFTMQNIHEVGLYTFEDAVVLIMLCVPQEAVRGITVPVKRTNIFMVSL